MSKPFDAATLQRRAAELRATLIDRRYQHYKGGVYIIAWIDVDEATGDLRVSYTDEARREAWNRTFSNFTELVGVDGRPRFEPLPSGGERGKYAKRYAESQGQSLGNCVVDGRTLQTRGYKCGVHGLLCAYCVNDWRCPKCGAAVTMVSR